METARIRLGYTEVVADWYSDKEQRLVAERYVDEGETVSANRPLLKIVRLDPVTAVIFVTEKEYSGLQTDQQVSLTTDAYPDRTFSGVIERIAPVFREAILQARIEVKMRNPDLQLEPGMFVRAKVIFEQLDEATVVPIQTLTRRDEQEGVFVVSEDGRQVTWRTVSPGIRRDERVQIGGEGLQGWVVVLGQQLLDDGSAVLLSEQKQAP